MKESKSSGPEEKREEVIAGAFGVAGTIGSVAVAGGGTSGAAIMSGLATLGLGSALLGIPVAGLIGYGVYSLFKNGQHEAQPPEQ